MSAYLPSAPGDIAEACWRREQFLAAMSLVTTPVTVVATDGVGGRFGQTVSAMCSVSAEPPLILICISRRSPTCAAIDVNECFSVNLLSVGQAPVSDTFAGRPASGDAYDFSCARWTDRVTGAPVLVGAAATFDCRLERADDVATHRILVGSVVDTCLWPSGSLAYRQREYGSHSPLFGSPEDRPNVRLDEGYGRRLPPAPLKSPQIGDAE